MGLAAMTDNLGLPSIAPHPVGSPILAVLILTFVVYLAVLAITHVRGFTVGWRFALGLAMVLGCTAGAVTGCAMATLWAP
jgi:hypothetical protein